MKKKGASAAKTKPATKAGAGKTGAVKAGGGAAKARVGAAKAGGEGAGGKKGGVVKKEAGKATKPVNAANRKCVIKMKQSSGANKKLSKADAAKKKKEEEEKLAQEEARIEEERKKHEEYMKETNARLKREKEEAEAKAAALKAEMEPDEKGVRHVPLTRLNEAIGLINKEGKWPLILDTSGKVDTFYQYQNTTTIAAKGVFLKVAVQKSHTHEEVMEELRKQLVNAIKNGHFLHICMENGATNFSGQFNGDTTFPIDVFQYGTYDSEEKCLPVIRDKDRDHNGFFFPNENYRVIVTSRFEEEDYEEFLQDSIPLEKLGVVVVSIEK